MTALLASALVPVVLGVPDPAVAMGTGAPAAGPADPALFAKLRLPEERFGLSGTPGELALRLDEASVAAAPREDAPPKPLVAGVLSAIVPGSGQLLQGDSRGWIYLGAEAALWFSYLAVHDAAAQAEEDYKQFADAYWSFDRYESVSDCGEGLGPQDFEEERDALLDAYRNYPDQYYQDIADEKVYACGWEAQSQRAHYGSMIEDADNLYSAGTWIVGAVVLNHVVSAIDAAKSASNKQKTWLQSLQVAPVRDGLRVELARSF